MPNIDCVLVSGCVGIYGSNRVVYDAKLTGYMNDMKAFEAINKKQEDFLRDLQSSPILKADLSKVDDKLDQAKLEAAKSIEAKKYLDRYLAFVNSLNGNDLEKAVKEYA